MLPVHTNAHYVPLLHHSFTCGFHIRDDHHIDKIQLSRPSVLPNDVFILLLLSFAFLPFPIHDRRINICRRRRVWFVEQRNDTEQNCTVKQFENNADDCL